MKKKIPEMMEKIEEITKVLAQEKRK